MDMERERLTQLYRETGDEQLINMRRNAKDLTDTAQVALAEELHRRGLVEMGWENDEMPPTEAPELEEGFANGIPGIFPSGAVAVEQALEPGGRESFGRVSLINFYDGLELSKACQILEDGDVEIEIEAINGDAMSGTPPHHAIWVFQQDREHAERLLRRGMGLFPAPEMDIEGNPTEDSDGLVGQFETRGEAAEVAGILVAGGFTPALKETDGVYAVEVAPAETYRALNLVAAKLDLE